ncbi:hypothetical protein SHLI107390_10910 [Shewanella livingstonensis]
MDGELALEVKGRPIASVSIFILYHKEVAEEHSDEVQSWINFRRNFFAAAGWNLAILVWCGRSATKLVAAGHKYKTT